jgi:hypothetical protein
VLDTLHLRKIDLADEVLVVNPGAYIGDSTRREIAYARSLGKPVRSTHPVQDGDDSGWQHIDRVDRSLPPMRQCSRRFLP